MFIEKKLSTVLSSGECLNGIHTVDLVGTTYQLPMCCENILSLPNQRYESCSMPKAHAANGIQRD